MLAPKVLFPGQQQSETVHLVIREHWFYLLSQLVVWFLFIVILFAMDHYLPIYMPKLLEQPYVGYYNLFKDLYMIFLMLGVFMIWSIYYMNFQIITDQRIVDVSQDNLFSHTVSELGLDKIEDVTGKIEGFFGTVFSFGNVYVQTAGKEGYFTFKNVPSPDKVEKIILDLYQKRPIS